MVLVVLTRERRGISEQPMRADNDLRPITISVQVQEFPAPVCDECLVPMWLNKTIRHCGDEATSLRLDFLCPHCNAKVVLRRQRPVQAGPRW